MRKKAAIIVNPVSGKGAALGKALKAGEILGRAGAETVLYKTGGPGRGRELARSCAPFADVLVSVGGDGTLNEVINGVADAGLTTPIAIVPTGTANVVARELDLPKNLEAQVMPALEGRLRKLDLGCAGDRRFTMCAGAGLDAAIVEAVSRRRTGRGFTMLHYVIPAVMSAMSYGYPAIRVKVDGVRVDETADFVVVANMARYGGLFHLVRDAAPDDGLLDVCCFHGKRSRDLIRYARAAFRGSLQRLDGVTRYRGREIALDSGDPVPFQMDGDPCGNLPVTIAVLQGGMTVCVPEAGQAGD